MYQPYKKGSTPTVKAARYIYRKSNRNYKRAIVYYIWFIYESEFQLYEQTGQLSAAVL